jgi:hypothetical protein
VQWSVGGGHFIMVVGWTVDAAGDQSVHVLDPCTIPGGNLVAVAIWPYDEFANGYEISGVSGTINYSYEVK